MTRKIKILITVLTLLLLSSLYIYYNRHNYYTFGESDSFNLNLGNEFKIKIRHNGSTGYSNCWVNKNNCRHTVLVQRKYKSSFYEMLGFVGAGGTEYLTFKATSIGIDTIKISSIPPGYECNCKEVKDISVTLSFPTKYLFIVTIKN